MRKALSDDAMRRGAHEVQPLGPWVMSALREPAFRLPVMRTVPAKAKFDKNLRRRTA
jgi:hypothetical protein